MADITYQLNFTGKQINNLLTRTNNLDTELNNYLLKNGGNMTGAINMNGNTIFGLNEPTEDTEVAQKSYVDKMLPKTGGTMSGPITMGGNKVTDLGAPVNDGDAANKVYVDDIVAKIYPVGAIYMSTNSTSPASLFGGTWEQLKDRFLLGAGNTYGAGTTGGEATHTLTEAEMPNHYHQQYVGALDGSWGVRSDYQADGNFAGFPQGMTGSVGGNQPHNNMPPYLAVYMWKRVA